MSTISRLSEDEIKGMALDIVRGDLFVASMAPAELMPSIFLPLALGGITKEAAEELGNIVAPLAEAANRSVNGYPIFMSCQLVHKDDWSRVIERVERAQNALKEALDD